MKIEELISSRREEISSRIVDLQYGLQPEMWNRYGEAGKKISIRDAGYHLPFLVESVLSQDASIFRNYVAWVKKLFRGLNFPDAAMIVTLTCTEKVLSGYLEPAEMALVSDIIREGLRVMDEEPEPDISFIRPDNPLFDAVTRFHQCLVEGDRITASRVVLNLVESGTPVRDVYRHIFQVSQYEVGRRWMNNEITVAQEHFCSAATQLIMSQLYPYIFTGIQSERKMIGACIGGELHEIGIRMVCDFFEMDGWNTWYLGANLPARNIIQAVDKNRASVLGLSIAMPYHGQLLKETIREIRSTDSGHRLKILIGGNAVNERNGNYEYFGADGYARDAQTAVQFANSMLS